MCCSPGAVIAAQRQLIDALQPGSASQQAQEEPVDQAAPSAGSEAAGEEEAPKAAAAAPAATDSAGEELAAAQEEAQEATTASGPAGEAAGQPAAAATPEGFKSWGLCPLFGSYAAASPVAQFGLKTMSAAAADKEQRAPN